MSTREIFIGKDTKLRLVATCKFAIETSHLSLLFDDYFPFNRDSLMLHSHGHPVASLTLDEESLKKFKFFIGRNR